MATITIQMDTTDEALVGGWGWESFDPRASIDEFKARIIKRIQEVYSGYAVEIEETDYANTVTIEDGRGRDPETWDTELREIEEDQQAIREIISEVWSAIEEDQQAIREIISEVWSAADWHQEA